MDLLRRIVISRLRGNDSPLTTLKNREIVIPAKAGIQYFFFPNQLLKKPFLPSW